MDKNLKIFMTIGVALGGVYVLSEMFKSKAITPAKENPQTPSNEPERASMFTASDDFFSKFTAGDDFFSYTANEGNFFNMHGSKVSVATDEPNFTYFNGKPLPTKDKKYKEVDMSTVPLRPKRKGRK
jgi:hypothetical protein